MEHKKTEKSYFIFETSLKLYGSNRLMIISAPSSVTPHKKLYKEEWSNAHSVRVYFIKENNL